MKKKYNKPLTPDQLAAMSDADIDFSDAPELDATFWANAKIIVPDEAKQQITLRLDADMLDWFRAQGRGYQTKINAVLRSFYDSQNRVQ